MINYNKIRLIKECMSEYYSAYAETLDTCEYVPESVNKKIIKKIYKCQNKTFRQIEKYDKKYQKAYKVYIRLSICDKNSKEYVYLLKRFERLNKYNYIDVISDNKEE